MSDRSARQLRLQLRPDQPHHRQEPNAVVLRPLHARQMTIAGIGIARQRRELWPCYLEDFDIRSDQFLLLRLSHLASVNNRSSSIL